MTIDFFKHTILAIRKGVGHYDGLTWVDGIDENIEILASVQPTSPEDLETLPEGYRTKKAYTLITDTELQTANESRSNPDFVFIDGEKYQVTKVSKWGNTDILKHFTIIVTRDDRDAA